MTNVELNEDKNLSDEEQRLLLKQYLKDFYIFFDDKEEEKFKQVIGLNNLSSCIIKAESFETLKKAICYILLSFNRKINYYYFKDSDIMEKMLSDNSDEINEDVNFNDIENVPLLIVYHPAFYKKNRILWETLNFLIHNRKEQNKATIIITDADAISDEHGYLQCDNIFNLTDVSFANNYCPLVDNFNNVNIDSMFGIPQAVNTYGLYGD